MDDFIFDGKTLSDFGYIICAFDSLSDETISVSNMEFTTAKAPLSDVSVRLSSSYPENLTKTIQICKNPCMANDDIITAYDLSELSRWLCRKDYKWFAWNSNDDYGEVWYEAQITISKIMIANKCRGLELVINTNRPYAVTPLINIKLNRSNDESVNSVDVKVFSDEEGIIYPDVIIKPNATGKLTLTNTYDNTKTIIQCINGETITIHGDILQIETSSSRSLYDEDNFNYVFPHFCSSFDQHINTFTADLDCDITFSYREIRKVGI